MLDLSAELLRLSENVGEPGSFRDLAGTRRRRERRRRAGGLLVGFLVIAAAGVFLVATFRERSSGTPADNAPLAWATHTDQYGWTIDVPEGWRTQTVPAAGGGTLGAVFIGEAMSIQVSIEPAPSSSLPHGPKLPPGLTLPPSNDSRFPLSADQLLAQVEGGLGGKFNGDGQRFDVLVLSPFLPDPLPRTDADILNHMIGSISFQPWTPGELRHGWAAIETPTQDVSWITVRGGEYILFRTADGYRLYGSISCAGKPPSGTSATSDGFAVLDCPDGSSWEMNAPGASGGGGDAAKNDPPPEWLVVTAHDGTLIAFVIPGYFPPGTGGAS